MAELIKIPDKTEYITQLGDVPANIKLSSLYNINFSKWEDEVWLNLNLTDLAISDEKTNLKDGIVEVTKGNMKYQSWVLNNNVLEYCIHYSSTPSKFQIEFDILDSGNLSYFYQPALTQSELNMGHIRPDNVVGSYAVYSNRKNGQYKTGKFKHIYRWIVTDANGKKEWCEPLKIEAGKLIIGLPVNFVKNAKYPIFAMGAGDTFGYNSIGASGKFHSFGHAYAIHGTTGTSGTTSKIYIGVHSATAGDKTANVAIYDDAGNDEPENQLPDGSGNDEVSITIPGGTSGVYVNTNYVQSLSGATKYWIAIGHTLGSTVYFRYDSGGANDSNHFNLGSDNLPASWSDTTTNGNKQWSFYADYTAAGGVSVDATTDTLTLTEQSADVNLDVSVSASTDALTLTEQSADVNLDVSVAGSVDALILTEQSADVKVDENVLASTDALTLTEYGATVLVGDDIEVSAEVDALTLTEYTAGIKADITISAGIDALTLTEQAADVNLDVLVSGSVDNLTLSELTAGVKVDRNVLAGYDELIISEYTASIDVGAVTLQRRKKLILLGVGN